MGRRALRWVLAMGMVTASTLACVSSRPTPAGCRARAEAEYKRCTNPQAIPLGEPVEPVRGDRTQLCREAYHQALDACRVEPEPPTPHIQTATVAEP